MFQSPRTLSSEWRLQPSNQPPLSRHCPRHRLTWSGKTLLKVGLPNRSSPFSSISHGVSRITQLRLRPPPALLATAVRQHVLREERELFHVSKRVNASLVRCPPEAGEPGQRGICTEKMIWIVKCGFTRLAHELCPALVFSACEPRYQRRAGMPSTARCPRSPLSRGDCCGQCLSAEMKPRYVFLFCVLFFLMCFESEGVVAQEETTNRHHCQSDSLCCKNGGDK